jgi:hypothetical protein
MTLSTNERINDQQEALRSAIEGQTSTIQTAMPGIIISFDASVGTVAVQPVVQASVRKSDGSYSFMALPVLQDVPVCFPGGGGFTLTFPVKAGDECLLVFASRCIDAWWQLGGVQAPIEPRAHALSDATAFVGLRNSTRPLPAFNTSGTQLRSDDGNTYIEVLPSGFTKIVTPAGLDIIGDVRLQGSLTATGTGGTEATITGNIVLNGSMTASGSITASEVTAGTTVLTTHKHGGVVAGGAQTGVPV